MSNTVTSTFSIFFSGISRQEANGLHFFGPFSIVIAATAGFTEMMQKKKETSTKRHNRVLAYLRDDEMKKLNKYIKDKYGMDQMDVGIARVIIMEFLTGKGY